MIAALYALAIAALLVYGLHALVLAVWQVRHEALLAGPVPDPHAGPSPDEGWPAVTVQLPLYNEPLVVERLIDACVALDYPRSRLSIQVLDDSTDETSALAARRVRHWKAQGVDIVHLRRRHREGFKAGALQHGLRFTDAPFVAIFDADFLPGPSFLARTIPAFDAPEVGLVQARWGHLNADASLLTRMQALGLDTHFALEQDVRHRAGLFMNFNGTAGVWRRACIDAAGGWQGDTLAEDLDLSYRAQLAGWQFRFLPDVEAPAELPETLSALRAQQFRWTKGGAETARKLLPALWRSDQPRRVKGAGTLHLTGYLVFPFTLLAALLHAPLLLLRHAGIDPGEAYFALLGLGLVGFAGFFLAQVLGQRALYPDWAQRLRRFPLFLAGSMGLSLSNSRAVLEALAGKQTPFVRTPKGVTAALGDGAAPASPRPKRPARRAWPWAEGTAALYCIAGLLGILWVGEWAAVPFQALFALGFGLVTWLHLREQHAVAPI